jgi:superfamily II DNA/RNA helicase
MPAHKTPLSLEELLALKRKQTENEQETKNTEKNGIIKAKFLTKTQRENLGNQKIQDVKPQEGLKSKIKQPTIQAFLDDEAENRNESIEINNSKKSSKHKYKFSWDDSEDTSLNTAIPILIKHKEKDYSLDLPTRKKSKTNGVDYINTHWSKKPLNQMSDRDWRILKEDYNISIKNSATKNILRNWEESKMPKQIIENLLQLKYKEPTPIQRATIPPVLDGSDVLGIAETGSGKTLSFLLPAISYVLNLPPVRPFESPYVLIIVPTRELAQQIETECQKFMNKLHFNVASIVGGHTYDENISKLEKGVEILIGTPGRLLDVLEKKLVELNKCFFLVADEADRMIDMGFEKQVQSLIDRLPPGTENPFEKGDKQAKRTTLMFTATMPPSIQKMVSKYLVNPTTITVGDINNAVETVVQDAIQVPQDDDRKMNILRNVLNKFTFPIVIFVNFQKSCDMLANQLRQWGFRPTVIHGGKTQAQREEAIHQMKSGNADILIATDVAARGIDIPNVSLVVNYQMTKSISEYVHRIGRTGRAGKRGTAITFWNPESDGEILFDLKSMILKSDISRCPKDLFHHDLAKIKDFKNIES